MKLVWLGIVIVMVAIGFHGKREARNVSGAPPAPESTDTASQVPTSVGIPATPASPKATVPTSAADRIQPRLEKIQELARFTLPTQDAKDSLIRTLSERDLQKDLGHVLMDSDHRPFDASQEKLRMNAVSVVGLMLRYPDVRHREDMVQWVKQRILTVDFNAMKDLQVKQSVYGDITELLMILRQYDQESYNEVSQRITETKNKVLKTALAASR